jgi:hypothetical protein
LKIWGARELGVDNENCTRALAATEPFERCLNPVEAVNVRDDVPEVELPPSASCASSGSSAAGSPEP